MAITFLRAGMMAALLLLAGCDNGEQAKPTVLEGKTMGTPVACQRGGYQHATGAGVAAKIQAQLDGDDHLLSTWKNDSALMRFNHATSTAPSARQRCHGGYRHHVVACWRENRRRDGYYRWATGEFVGIRAGQTASQNT